MGLFSTTQSRRFALLVALASVIVSERSAHAEPPAVAQALFDQGRRAMSEGRYAEACPKFEESLSLEFGLGTLLNLADCEEHIDKLATAWSLFRDAAMKARAAGQSERATIASTRAAALEHRLPTLTIVVDDPAPPPEFHLTRDGAEVHIPEWGSPLPVDAGLHTISASAPGRRRWQASVEVIDDSGPVEVHVPALDRQMEAAESSRGLQSFDAFASTRQPPPVRRARDGRAALRWGAIAAAAFGVAGVVTGTYFFVRSVDLHNQARRTCPTASCVDATGSTLWHEAVMTGNAATVAFTSSGVAFALAAGLFVPSIVPRSGGGVAVQLAMTY